MRIATAALTLTLLLAGISQAESPSRWLPDHCLTHVDADTPARWNDAYNRGFRAIQAGEYFTAESEMCRALLAAREFDARDWRFAETLDELGLIAFEARNFELAEQMQGAAIAEMLLAVGPAGEPLRGHGETNDSVIRPNSTTTTTSSFGTPAI